MGSCLAEHPNGAIHLYQHILGVQAGFNGHAVKNATHQVQGLATQFAPNIRHTIRDLACGAATSTSLSHLGHVMG